MARKLPPQLQARYQALMKAAAQAQAQAAKL